MTTILKPVPAVGSVCFKGNQVILVRRGHPPGAGEWSIPGGRIEFGEPAETASLRELREETGVNAELLTLIEIVEHIPETPYRADPDNHFVIIEYLTRWISGDPVAGDDARDARFVPLSELDKFGLSEEARRVILKGYDLMQAIELKGMQ
ncbi:MAG: NUDIX hydrolase [Pseudomonadota bacterium]